jgi:hypothetical protein
MMGEDSKKKESESAPYKKSDEKKIMMDWCWQC